MYDISSYEIFYVTIVTLFTEMYKICKETVNTVCNLLPTKVRQSMQFIKFNYHHKCSHLRMVVKF